MKHRFIELRVDAGVATVTLNRPPVNVLNIEMMEEVNAALLALREQRAVKVLVIRAKGKTFSAGVDVADHTRDKVSRMLQVFHRIFETIRMLDVVSVAAVQGPALGGGFELAIGCNLIVAGESARFALPEIKFGVFPPVACVVLPRISPRRKAMEWILTGQDIPPEELRQYGLINRIFPDQEFDAGLTAFVAQLTDKSAPVLQLAKRAQYESYYSTYDDALSKAENLYLRDLMTLADPHEGIQAFLEKRDPSWRDA